MQNFSRSPKFTLSLRGSISVLVLLVVLIGEMALHAKSSSAGEDSKTSKWSVGVLNGLNQENCSKVIQAAFERQGLTPAKDPNIDQAIKRACEMGVYNAVLVIPEKEQEKKQTISFDVTGSASRGNVEAGTIAGAAAYKRKFESHTVDLKLNGAFLLDSDTVYQMFSIQGGEEFFLSNHWALFAEVAVGQDSRKNQELFSRELLGASLNLLGKDHSRQIKISGAIGHRFEVPLDGQALPVENNLGFSNNNAIASFRLKYEEKFLDDALELMAAVWFQNILYAPGSTEKTSRFMDLDDYRTMFQVSFKVKVAELSGGAKLYTNLEGSYEFYAQPLTNSPYDLQIQGGLGVQF